MAAFVVHVLFVSWLDELAVAVTEHTHVICISVSCLCCDGHAVGDVGDDDDVSVSVDGG